MTSDEGWVFDGETVVADSSDAAFVVGTERTIVYATDAFVAATGHARQELLGSEYTTGSQFLVDGIAELHAAIEGVLQGTINYERIEVITTAGRTDASQQSLQEAQVTPVVQDGQFGGALVVFRGEETIGERVGETYQRYRALVEQNRDGVTITQNGKNVFVNNRFAAMVGYQKTELIGESFLKPIAPEDRNLVEERHERRLRGESPPKRYELSLRTKTGDALIVEINIAPIQYGGERAVMASYRDITERKCREDELRRFRRAIETAPHAIVLTEADGTITYINPAFEEITGYSRDEALGRTPQLYFSEEIPDSLHEEMWETITGGDVWEGYLLNQRATGDLYHAHETVAPIVATDGAVEGFVGIQTDISERVEREQLVDTLDRVLRHNLRNKLNVVQAHGSLIRTQQSGDPDSHVETILDSVDDLLETTQKGREIIKFLSYPSQTRPTESVEVVRRATRDVRDSFSGARITLDLPEEAYVSAVPELHAAVEELLTNAIEHNDQPTPNVSVCLTVEGESVELYIADNGPGISKMEREILSETRDIDQLYHGSGFGLWLVYWIVRQSGGEITITDRTPRGTVVRVTFDSPPSVSTEVTPDSNPATQPAHDDETDSYE
ncbi:PAS domain S-box protein [Salinibaculum salinum]|uniref:PAS domain S-box protein n=1 Tax=Salinibaculum salinum TaxID=3131996 RepID=UPI0030EE1B02